MPLHSKEPIFIVGFPRSGTTLLTAMLSSHSQLGGGPETQFFEKIPARRLYDCVEDNAWPRKAVHALMSLELVEQSVVALYNLDKAQLETGLKARPASIQNMLEALTIPAAHAQGKARWIEKTPNHLKHLQMIRTLYPQAPVIRIIRDPRDVAASMTRLPHTNSDPFVNIYECRKWHDVSQSFFAKDMHSVTVRYEDLIRLPKETLCKICDTIGENFEESMLNFAESSDLVGSKNETWKEGVSGKLDATRLSEWKKRIPAEDHDLFSLVFWEYLQEFGYETSGVLKRDAHVFRISPDWILANKNFLRAEAKQGTRWLSTSNIKQAQRNRGMFFVTLMRKALRKLRSAASQ